MLSRITLLLLMALSTSCGKNFIHDHKLLEEPEDRRPEWLKELFNIFKPFTSSQRTLTDPNIRVVKTDHDSSGFSISFEAHSPADAEHSHWNRVRLNKFQENHPGHTITKESSQGTTTYNLFMKNPNSSPSSAGIGDISLSINISSYYSSNLNYLHLQESIGLGYVQEIIMDPAKQKHRDVYQEWRAPYSDAPQSMAKSLFDILTAIAINIDHAIVDQDILEKYGENPSEDEKFMAELRKTRLAAQTHNDPASKKLIRRTFSQPQLLPDGTLLEGMATVTLEQNKSRIECVQINFERYNCEIGLFSDDINWGTHKSSLPALLYHGMELLNLNLFRIIGTTGEEFSMRALQVWNADETEEPLQLLRCFANSTRTKFGCWWQGDGKELPKDGLILE